MHRHRFSIIGFFVGWIAKLLYFASLTSLIPFGAMLLTARPQKIPETLAYFPLTAIGLLLISAFVLLVYHKNLGHTISTLGWMTLIPGIGSLVFMFVNPQAVLDLFAKVILGFDKIEQYIMSYLDDVLPKVWLFIAAYILLGIVLISVGRKMEHKQTLMSYFRKVFGPRVRFY
jgi:hypothetical protein